MKYKIVCIGDIHFGSMKLKEQLDHLSLFINFLSNPDNIIDLLVILGDYFDSKIILNSPTAIASLQFFQRVYEICKSRNIKFRIIKGTHDHDNNQLEAFREFEKDDFFKIFTTCITEETLPGLQCLYCPEENINFKTYQEKYIDYLCIDNDIAFVHGTFDVFLPVKLEDNEFNLVYEYNIISTHVNGPILAGHWHTHNQYKKLIYVGSYDRWKFNEEEDKGFGYVTIDTDTKEYVYEHIINTLAINYHTFTINTSTINSIDDIHKIIVSITHIMGLDDNLKMKIKYIVDDVKDTNEVYLNTLKDYYSKNKRVKIIVRNLSEVKKKEEKKKAVFQDMSQYSFIFDKNKSISEIIHEYIMMYYNKDIDVEKIRSVIEKYIK